MRDGTPGLAVGAGGRPRESLTGAVRAWAETDELLRKEDPEHEPGFALGCGRAGRLNAASTTVATASG